MKIGLGLSMSRRGGGGDTAPPVFNAPDAPTAPVVIPTGTSTLDIEWSEPLDGGSAITQYNLRHSTDEAAWTTVNDVTSPHEITGLAADTAYFVQVNAVNAIGTSAWSASGTASTDAVVVGENTAFVGHSLVSPQLPEIYDEVTTDTVNYQVINGAPLSWNWDNHATAEGVSVRDLLGTGVVDHLVLAEGGPIEEKIAFENTRGELAQWRGAGITANPDMITYWYEIWPEIDDWATTPDWAGWVTEIERLAEEAYAVVLEQVASDIDPAKVYLSPVGSVFAALYEEFALNGLPDVTNFKTTFFPIDNIHPATIGYYVSAMVHYATTKQATPVSLEWDLADPIDGLTENLATSIQTIAWAVVSAHPYAGITTWPVADTAPDTPATPTLVATGTTTADASWIAPDNGGSVITAYNLRYSTDEATWTTVNGVTSPHELTGLTADTLYYIQVNAVNAIGTSGWSASGSDTTDAEVPAGGVDIVYLGTTAETYWDNNLVSSTFDFGVAAADRQIVGICHYLDGGAYPSAASIGGQAATLDVINANGGGGFAAGIIRASVPSGTGSQAFTVTSVVGYHGRYIIDWYRVDGASTTLVDTATSDIPATGSPRVMAIDSVTDGAIIAGISHFNDAINVVTISDGYTQISGLEETLRNTSGYLGMVATETTDVTFTADQSNFGASVAISLAPA